MPSIPAAFPFRLPKCYSPHNADTDQEKASAELLYI